MMRFVLFALVGILAVNAQPVSLAVTIAFAHNEITVSLPTTDKDITAVDFRYGEKNPNHNGRGVLGADGWYFHAELHAHAGQTLHAFAIIHYSSGLLIQTPQVAHVVGGGNPATAAPTSTTAAHVTTAAPATTPATATTAQPATTAAPSTPTAPATTAAPSTPTATTPKP